jgi:hypothetical protein
LASQEQRMEWGVGTPLEQRKRAGAGATFSHPQSTIPREASFTEELWLSWHFYISSLFFAYAIVAQLLSPGPFFNQSWCFSGCSWMRLRSCGWDHAHEREKKINK